MSWVGAPAGDSVAIEAMMECARERGSDRKRKERGHCVFFVLFVK